MFQAKLVARNVHKFSIKSNNEQTTHLVRAEVIENIYSGLFRQFSYPPSPSPSANLGTAVSHGDYQHRRVFHRIWIVLHRSSLDFGGKCRLFASIHTINFDSISFFCQFAGARAERVQYFRFIRYGILIASHVFIRVGSI